MTDRVRAGKLVPDYVLSFAGDTSKPREGYPGQAVLPEGYSLLPHRELLLKDMASRAPPQTC